MQIFKQKPVVYNWFLAFFIKFNLLEKLSLFFYYCNYQWMTKYSDTKNNLLKFP